MKAYETLQTPRIKAGENWSHYRSQRPQNTLVNVQTTGKSTEVGGDLFPDQCLLWLRQLTGTPKPDKWLLMRLAGSFWMLHQEMPSKQIPHKKKQS